MKRLSFKAFHKFVTFLLTRQTAKRNNFLRESGVFPPLFYLCVVAVAVCVQVYCLELELDKSYPGLFDY